MAFTGQIGTALSMPGNIMPGGPVPLVTAAPRYPSLRFEVNFDDDPSIEFPPTGYTDVSSRVRQFSTRRGRSNIVDRVEGGVATVLLDNRDGMFNPAQPGRLLLRRARVQAFYDGTYFPIYTGHIESYRYSYPGVDHDAVCEVTLSDGLKILSRQKLPPAYVREAESTDARLASVLEEAGIGSSYRSINATYIDTDALAPVRVTPSDVASLFTLSATLADNDATVTVASTTGLAGGMAVSGTGIPAGATVDVVTDSTHFEIKNDQDPAYGKAFLSRSKDTVFPGSAGPWFEITGISDTKDLSVGMHVGPYYNSDGALLFDHTVTEVQSDRVIVSTPITQTWRGPGNPGGVATGVPFTAGTSQTLTVEKSYLPVEGALEHVRAVEDTERGLFVIKADGTYEYQGSGYRPAQATAMTFGEQAGEVPYSEAPIAYDDQNLVNEYIVENIYNGTSQTFSDATSQAHYLRISATIQQSWAGNKFKLPEDQRVFEPIPRLEGIRVAPATNPTSLWRKCLNLDVSSRVDVRRRPMGGADIFAPYDQFIEAVEHDADASDWRIRFVTSPVREAGAGIPAGPTLTLTGSPTFNPDSSVTIDSPDQVQAPASLLDETQSWFACRVNTLASAAAMSTDARLFSFEDADTAMVTLYWSGSGKTFGMARQNGGTFGQATTAAQTFAAGDDLTIIGTWTGTQLKVSVNGGAFTTGAQSSVPTVAATLWDIGRRSISATQYFSAAFFWVAVGSGTLADGDATTIHAFGNTDHPPSDFPGGCNMVWPAESAATWAPEPDPYPGGFDGPQIGFSTHLEASALGTPLVQAQKAAAAGATVIRNDLSWKTTETSNGTYNWSQLDAIGNACVSTGLKCVLQCGYAPAWANGGSGNDKIGPDASHIADFGDHIRQVALRCHNNYPGTFIALEYWNEPNINFLTNPANSKIGDATYYTSLAQAAYNATRGISPVSTDAAPEIELWAGATAGLGEYQGAIEADAWNWLTEALGAGILNYCDGWSCHPYQYVTDATTAYLTEITSGSWGHNWSRVFWACTNGANLATRLSNAGYTGYIHGTEWGAPTYAYPSGTHITDTTAETNQAGLFPTSWNNWTAQPKAGHLFFYTLKDDNSSTSAVPPGREAHFGAYRDDWSEKPIVANMQAV